MLDSCPSLLATQAIVSLHQGEEEAGKTGLVLVEAAAGQAQAQVVAVAHSVLVNAWEM